MTKEDIRVQALALASSLAPSHASAEAIIAEAKKIADFIEGRDPETK